MPDRALKAAMVLLASVASALPAAAQTLVRFPPVQALTAPGIRAVHPSVVVDQAGGTHVVFNQSGKLYYTHNLPGSFMAPVVLDDGLGASPLLPANIPLAQMIIAGVTVAE